MPRSLFEMTPGPALNWVDAWLLAALTTGRWRWSRPMKPWELIDACDWLFRGQPTFDDVSFSLPRLIATGYVVADRDRSGRLRVKATPAAFLAVSRITKRLDPVARMAEALDAARDHGPILGDRSLGRFHDLDHGEWSAAEDRLAVSYR